MMELDCSTDIASMTPTLVDACLQRVTEISYSQDDLSRSEEIMNKLVASEPLLTKIHLKSQKRCLTDRKVAPGSDSVVCSILNARYCLCLLNTNMGKQYELQSDTYDLAITCYQRALIWYPHSIEAGHLLGLCLRSRAVTAEKLDFVQYIWERAMAAATQTLETAGLPGTRTAGGTALGTAPSSPFTLPQQKVWDILLSSSSPFPSSELESALSKSFVDNSTIASCVGRAQAALEFREREAAKVLQDSLILFYCQENQLDNAYPLLLLKRYQWKLSQQVLTHATEEGQSKEAKEEEARQVQLLEPRADFPFTFGYDSVLPEIYLQRLQHVFRPSAPFWSEHQYDFYSNCSRKVGYFSYLYPFRDRSASNVIEQVIDIVYQTVTAQLEASNSDSSISRKQNGEQCLEALRSEATVAEWWVHSRPHTSGHQFHFDSDETALYGGEQAQHPIASCIIYLSEGVGGPTVVTNQTLASPHLASYGFLMQPKENRLAVFDATFLHGVVPGRGLCPGEREDAKEQEKQEGDTHEAAPRRRLSFMVGFWRKIKAKERGPGCSGPGQPFPDTLSRQEEGEGVKRELNHDYTWPEEMQDMLAPPLPLPLPPAAEDVGGVRTLTSNNTSSSRRVYPQWIEPIWEPVASLCRQAGSGAGAGHEENICAHYSTCFQGF